MSSVKYARFEVMTNSMFLPSRLPLRSASSTTQEIRSKLSSGSPPWNSILISLAGARSVKSSAFAAASDMSNRALSVVTRETWQY